MNTCFRQVGAAETDEAYSAYLSVFEWLNSIGARQWLRPVTREAFAERQRSGQLFGCYIDRCVAAVVTLACEASPYWHERLGSDVRWWIKTLAVVRAWRGSGVGALVMQECEEHVWHANSTEVFLDCVDVGFLPGYYSALGYSMLARKEITYPSGNTFPVVLMRKERPNKAPEPTPTAVTPRAMEMKIEMKQWICNRDEARDAPAAVVAHL